MPALVVFDTNALLLPFERRIRVESELERLLGPFEAVVPEPCMRELARLAREARGARRERAKAALAWSARFRTLPAEGPADAAALAAARNAAALFTNDVELIRKARAAGVVVVRLRGLSHLVLDTDLA